jgi:hypothetical protein
VLALPSIVTYGRYIEEARGMARMRSSATSAACSRTVKRFLKSS